MRWYKMKIVIDMEIDITEMELQKNSFEKIQSFLQSQAINYSLNSNNMDDISAINEYSEYFERYGTKYDLLDEFRENAIC